MAKGWSRSRFLYISWKPDTESAENHLRGFVAGRVVDMKPVRQFRVTCEGAEDMPWFRGRRQPIIH